MSTTMQLIVALILIGIGLVSGFFRVRTYVRNEKKALKEDLIDLLFGFFPVLIISIGAFLIGAAWLIHLLRRANG